MAAEPKPGVISSQTVTTTQHHATPIIAAAAPIVAAAPAISYSAPLVSPYYSPYVASPYVHSPYVASPYYASAGIWPGYYGAGLAAPVVSHAAAPIVSAGLTVPSVYGYSLNSGLVSPYANYLLLKKKK